MTDKSELKLTPALPAEMVSGDVYYSDQKLFFCDGKDTFRIPTFEEYASFLKTLKEVADLIKTPYEFMKSVSCEEHCDPSVNFHQPECHIARDLFWANQKIKSITNGVIQP